MATDKKYFKDIDLSTEDELSAFEPLNSYSYRDKVYSDFDPSDPECPKGVAEGRAEISENYRLSFKYDDELRYFLLSDDCYYFPTFNKKYPKQLGNFFTDGRFQISSQGELDFLSGIFDQTNLFILEVDDNTIADRIGQVDVPVDNKSSDAIRVYEDFDSSKFDPEDPRFYQYVKWFANEPISEWLSLSSCWKMILPYDPANPSTLSSLDVGFFNEETTPDQFQIILKNRYDAKMPMGHDVSPAYTESGDAGFIVDFDSFNIDSTKVDLSNILKIYVNYKRSRDGSITLYFNYYNYLNTPFVKFDEKGQLLADTIDGTYLMLGPGEEGRLDIAAQFRKYMDDRVVGILNTTLVTYAIFNVSDDKPKFIIRKIQEIAKDSLSRAGRLTTIKLDIPDTNAQLDTESGANGTVRIQINVGHEYLDGALFEFDLYYPVEILKYKPTRNGICTVTDCGDYIHVRTDVTNIDNIVLYFTTVNGQNTISTTMNGRYMLETVDERVISSDSPVEIAGGVGYLTFSSKDKRVLAVEDKTDSPNTKEIYTESGTSGYERYPDSMILTKR